jgi:hypothetical protein
MKFSKYLLLVFVSLMLFSCRQKPKIEDYGNNFLQEIIVTEEGHFRGMSIGDDIEKVRSGETAELIENERNYLFYSQKINDADYYNVAYYFDKSGLFDINFTSNFASKQNADALFIDLKDYFEKLYGDPKSEQDYLVWRTKSDVSNNIEIAMIAHQDTLQGGFINLTIMNYDY